MTTMLRGTVRTLVLATGALALAACQSARVMDVETYGDLGSFDTVVVQPFDTGSTEWVGDQGEHTPAEVQGELRDHLVRMLGEHGLTVVPDARPGAVVVRGKIVLVDAGSGAARFLVGFGAGQSKLVCDVELVDGGSGQPAVTFHVKGGSRGSTRGSYATLADARDAAEQIADFIAGLEEK